MGIKQQLIIPCHLCKLSEDVLALKVVETQSRHLKENISIEEISSIHHCKKRQSKKSQKRTKNMESKEKERDTDNGIQESVIQLRRLTNLSKFCVGKAEFIRPEKVIDLSNAKTHLIVVDRALRFLRELYKPANDPWTENDPQIEPQMIPGQEMILRLDCK